MGRFSIERWLIVVETEVRVVSTTGASSFIVTVSLAPPRESFTSNVLLPPTVTVTSRDSAGLNPCALARTV